MKDGKIKVQLNFYFDSSIGLLFYIPNFLQIFN
jgi:hypothetical protein